MHVTKMVILLQKESNFILVFPLFMIGLYAGWKYGYHYKQARRKGLLTEKDLRLRMKFAKDIKDTMTMGCGHLEYAFTYMLSTLYIKQILLIRQSSQKVWSGEKK